jgi:hypothetical protein
MSAAALLLVLAAGEVAIVRHEVAPERLAAWSALVPARPGLRGFRAPILEDAGLAPEPDFAHAADEGLARAERAVATRLAREGLRAALIAALEALGPERARREDALGLLARAGLPVDLLACWGEPRELARRVADGLAAGRSAAELRGELEALPFRFPPTLPGFRLMSESGEEPPGALRLQLSSSRDYAEPGEGGALDLVRQMAEFLPELPLTVSVAEQHLERLEREARALAERRTGPIQIVVQPLPVSQWAQDLAEAGHVERGGQREVWLLAPRYASRGEAGSSFVPGESLALEGLARTGRRIARSPLLFQGGNVLCARDPRDGVRWLVVGETEVARNRALGLARDEVLAAFRAEFGADRCLVLPAVSFHVDLELSLRAVGGELVAFLLDSSAAARSVARAGIDALERAGELGAEAAGAARAALEEGRLEDLMGPLDPLLAAHAHGVTGFDERLAARFSSGPADSGVGNLQRFLLALDVLAAERLTSEAATEGLDPNARAYLESLRRRERDRLLVAQALQGLGWRLVAVPGFSDSTRSANPLNGLQLPGLYLMPASGGLLAPLDRAGLEALSAALGTQVAVRAVLCDETQRRAGGLHCAVAVEPRP